MVFVLNFVAHRQKRRLLNRPLLLFKGTFELHTLLEKYHKIQPGNSSSF